MIFRLNAYTRIKVIGLFGGTSRFTLISITPNNKIIDISNTKKFPSGYLMYRNQGFYERR